jgi:chromate transport protein ChrA
MKHELLTHRLAYTILFLGLVIYTFLFLATWPNQVIQRIVILLMGLFYVVWGVSTHLHVKMISRRLILEYVGIALLSSIFLFLLTL